VIAPDFPIDGSLGLEVERNAGVHMPLPPHNDRYELPINSVVMDEMQTQVRTRHPGNRVDMRGAEVLLDVWYGDRHLE
jgi:hypothetical protein